MTRALCEAPLQSESSETLDPQNWNDIRALGHRMLDDICDIDALIAAVLDFGAQRSSADGGELLEVAQSPPLAM